MQLPRADDGRAVRRRRRQLRRGDRARRRRPDGVHAARADRLRRAVLLLHHPDDAGRAAERAGRRRAARGRARRGGRLQGDRADRRPPRLVRPRPRRRASSLVDLLRRARFAESARRLQPTAIRRPVPHQLARADGLLARRSSIWSRRPSASRRISICRCSTRATACSRRCAGPTRSSYYASLVDDIRARIPHASIGSDIIVGFPGETDDDFERAGGVSRALAADAHPRLPVLRSARARRRRRCADKVHGRGRARARARDPRDRSAADRALPRRRRSARSHRALTLEDGSLAVTGNYLKVRIPPGRARNEWVRVQADVTVMTASCWAADFFWPSTIS